jgi:hypothetical protein
MRKIMFIVAACALCSFAFVASAQAASLLSRGAQGRESAKPSAAKAKVYEWCGSDSGCSFKLEVWDKTKTWGESGITYGTLTKGKKGEITLTQYPANGGCYAVFYKVRGTKNYSGEEPSGQGAGCFAQTITLTYAS